MIRRGFWLTVGAVIGIYGYRRVSALGRRLSASLNPAATTGGARRNPAATTEGARRGVVNAARETFRFTRDVREGMELYMARQSAAAGSTLSTDHGSTDHGSTDHESTTYEPEDGH